MKNLINSKLPLSKEYKVIEKIFTLIGGKFFLHWMLPTNPGSKNPLFKFIWSKSYGFSAFDRKEKILDCKILIVIHVIGIVLYTFIFTSAVNHTINNIIWFIALQMMINVYPILCNLYIGFRCKRIEIIKNGSSRIDDPDT